MRFRVEEQKEKFNKNYGGDDNRQQAHENPDIRAFLTNAHFTKMIN